MPDPSPEEQFKIWAFRRSLQALRKCDGDSLAYLASKCPGLGRATAIATESAPLSDDPTAQDRVVNFLQAAAVHVTGRNMDALSAPALLIFGLLVEQRECVAFAAADRAAATKTQQQENTDPAAAPTPAPKLMSKNKLLAALNAMQFAEEPPAARKKDVIPMDMAFDLELEQKALAAKKQARTSGGSSSSAAAPAAKATRAEIAAAKTTAAAATTARTSKKATAQPSAGTGTAADDDEAHHLEVADAEAVAVVKRSTGPRATKVAPAAPAPAGSDAAAIAPAVARLVQVLTVTTAPVIAEKLAGQGIDATVGDVQAAVALLAAQDMVVVEHGIIYPLC